MKTQRQDHVSKANFDCRARTEHFADLAVVSDDSTAHWLPSRRHDSPGTYPVAGEESPATVVTQLTAAVDQADPEKAHCTTNVALSQGISGHRFRRCPSLYVSDRDSTSWSTS